MQYWQSGAELSWFGFDAHAMKHACALMCGVHTHACTAHCCTPHSCHSGLFSSDRIPRPCDKLHYWGGSLSTVECTSSIVQLHCDELCCACRLHWWTWLQLDGSCWARHCKDLHTAALLHVSSILEATASEFTNP
jgi:hypothetical protein